MSVRIWGSLHIGIICAETPATEFLFHASENAFAIKQKHGAESQIGHSFSMAFALKATNGHGFARFHAATAVPPPENDGARDVRFGSLADMCDAKPNVRLTPIADIAPSASTRRSTYISD